MDIEQQAAGGTTEFTQQHAGGAADEHQAQSASHEADQQVGGAVEKREQQAGVADELAELLRPTMPASLAQIGSEYSAHQRCLHDFMKDQQMTWPDSVWTEVHEQHWSRVMNPLRDRMAALRRDAIRKKARSVAELRVKATILSDFVDDHPNDECAQLTLSLCRDIAALSG